MSDTNQQQPAAPAAPAPAPTAASGQDNAATAVATQNAPPSDFLTGESVQVTPRAAPAPADGPSIEEILAYDPFTPPKKAAETPPAQAPLSAPATAPAGKPGEPVPAAAAPVAPVATPPVAAPTALPDPRDAEIAALKEGLKALQGTLKAVGDAAPARAAAAPAAAPADDDIPLPATGYRIGVPDQMVQGLASEDPVVRKQNLEQLVQGICLIVHKEIIRTARGEIDQRVPGLIGRVTQEQQNNQAIHNDYYSKFPAHASFAPFVGAMTRQFFAETGAQGWNAQIRDAIGQRVQAAIQSAVAGGQAVPSTVVPPGPVAPVAPAVAVATPSASSRPPHVFGGIASPTVGPAPGVPAPNSPEAIAATLLH